MADTLIVALSLLLNALLPYLIVREDLARLSEERLARAWPEASFWCAVYVFGPFSLPVHFARTRRSLLGFLLGFGCCVWCIAAQLDVTSLLAQWLGAD